MTNDAHPLTYGGREIWRRMQRRSGVERLGSHLVRYTVVQNAAHTSDRQSRHYAGDARRVGGAKTTAKDSRPESAA